jgi:hypothetical protein
LLPDPLKQADSQSGFEQGNGPADRSLREIQLDGGSREAVVTRGSLERDQLIDVGCQSPTSFHRSFAMRMT